MKRSHHIALLVIIVLPLFFSCRAISSFLHDDEIVAKAGKGVLYRYDLDQVIPKGLSKEDSTRFALQYITAWASDMVFLSIAEEQLPKGEQDVSRELEDYRRSILKYRYEQLYVNQRLDTAVTEELVQKYYEGHRDKFILTNPIVKARYLCIHPDSPVLESIKKKMSSEDPEEVALADSLAYSSALKFMRWDDRWIDVNVLAREFSSDWHTISSAAKGKWISLTDETGLLNVAYICQIMSAGQTAPVEYCEEKIKDIIISSRKQALITGLEQDLLKEARDNGTFVIY